MNQQQQPDAFGKGASEIFPGLIRCIALTLEVFLHRAIGRRAIECGFFGIVIMIVFADCFPAADRSLMDGFIALYGLVWVCKLTRSVVRRLRGRERGHTRYTGRPYLWLLLPGWKEEYVKHLEAALVILLGFVIRRWNHPLGDYLIFAAVVMLARGASLAFDLHERALDMHDSAIEQTCIAEKFREMHDE